MKVLMIVPAYNEEASILKTVNSIINYKPEDNIQIDYVVINDGSKDNTEKILIDNEINHISLVNNLGIGGAVQTGYIYAKQHDYDIAVQFDGDGQHDINSINNLINKLMIDNLDFCIGTRFGEKQSAFQSTFMRRVGIKYLSKLLKIVSFGKIKVSDPTSGYRAANRKVIGYFNTYYPIDYPEPESIMSLSRKKFKIGEVSVNMFEREEGSSSIGTLNSIYYMVKVSIAIIFDNFVKD